MNRGRLFLADDEMESDVVGERGRTGGRTSGNRQVVSARRRSGIHDVCGTAAAEPHDSRQNARPQSRPGSSALDLQQEDKDREQHHSY